MIFMIGNDVENAPLPAVDEAVASRLEEDVPVEKPGGASRPASFVRDLAETLLLAVLMFAVINGITARIRVEGISMRPTLESGSYVLVNRLAYRLGPPRHGDVIIFHFPQDPDQEYIKRIIGLPGDLVVVSNGEVRVNGDLVEEPYLLYSPEYESTLKVPSDQLYVLGDNRNNSSDSHQWGPVPMENVVGKAIVVYWPPQEWQIISHAQTSQ
jgi:signal peptidase I